jgi:hypothetical protein
MRQVGLLAVGVLVAGLSVPAAAETFIATIYNDRFSCPANCDAHVVFNEAHNGTTYASLPSSPRAAPVACKIGKACRICFDDSDASCLEVMYRGGGPEKGRFDFTKTFFEASCTKSNLPAVLAKKCRSFEDQFNKLTSNAVYCLSDPSAAGCRAVIEKAKAAKRADQPFWRECRRLGEVAYNRKHAKNPGKQRSHGCAYEKVGTGGPNSKGETWRRLLPASCRPGAYVGRTGLDCCDASRMSLGGLGEECSNFTVAR